MLEAEVTDLDVQPDPTEIQYVGWGGRYRTVTGDCYLGIGVFRTPSYGIRRVIWDAAFGYVSGFRKRDILYYIFTRSFSERVAMRVIEWEGERRAREQSE